MQIAVVDNEQRTRDYILNVMAYCVNREVMSFENADEMTTFLEQGNRVHLLLAKISSSDTSEIDSLKRLKHKFPQTHLVAISADAHDYTRAEKLGADVFLAKPFALNDLFKIVQTYVVDEPCEPKDPAVLRN